MGEMSSLMEHRNRPWVGAVLFIFLGAALVLGLSSDYFVRPICVALTRALHAACRRHAMCDVSERGFVGAAGAARASTTVAKIMAMRQ